MNKFFLWMICQNCEHFYISMSFIIALECKFMIVDEYIPVKNDVVSILFICFEQNQLLILAN
jgi:hypothetical protein